MKVETVKVVNIFKRAFVLQGTGTRTVPVIINCNCVIVSLVGGEIGIYKKSDRIRNPVHKGIHNTSAGMRYRDRVQHGYRIFEGERGKPT
jgi:hypothetical protein